MENQNNQTEISDQELAGNIKYQIKLNSTIKELKFYYYAVTGYFVALVLFIFCMYKLFGVYGGLAALSAYLFYFSMINMKVSSYNIDTIKNLPLKIVNQAPSSEVKTQPNQGQYL